jgi:large subunit ribosomal protein L23
MALFKKDSEKKSEVVAELNEFAWVLNKPRITEKAAMISGDNVYTFDVDTKANKILVKKAIKAQYKVTPLKVNIIADKARKVKRRGRKVHQSSSKKAMVFLKKGDTIELV